jgi:hypothetical protein
VFQPNELFSRPIKLILNFSFFFWLMFSQYACNLYCAHNFINRFAEDWENYISYHFKLEIQL